jgi:hypothetical protein
MLPVPFFLQEFLQELLVKDAKMESLVKMGFPEDEANMAIFRCGMLATELAACHFGHV